MRIVFFINKTNGFAKGMISYLEAKCSGIEKEYYVIDRREEESLPKAQNVHRILSYREFLMNRSLIRNVKTADRIFVSGVFTIQYVLPIYGRRVLEKTCWQFWGGDYTDFRKGESVGSLEVLVRRAFVTHCLRHAGGIVLLTAPERETFLEIFPFTAGIKMHYTPVPAGSGDSELLARIRNENNVPADYDTSVMAGHENAGAKGKVAEAGIYENEKKVRNLRRIVIGNSATATNCHLEIFEKLKGLDLQDAELYCPLSYGDDSYRETVIQKGQELFGDRFRPITEYMEYETYVRFLGTCEVGIYNNNRQQALGNIRRMLELGKKVYLPQIIREYFDQYGFITWPVESLETSTIEEILEFPKESSQHNVECIRKWNDRTERIWKEILLDR